MFLIILPIPAGDVVWPVLAHCVPIYYVNLVFGCYQDFAAHMTNILFG